MKTSRYWVLAAALLAACSGQSPDTSAPTKDKPASSSAQTPAATDASNAASPRPGAKPPADEAEANRIAQAEKLTQEQIKASRNPEALGKLGVLYYEQRDPQRLIWTMEQLTQLVPTSGNLRLQLAMAYAEQGDKTHAYDTLLRMNNLGFSYDIADDKRFDALHGTKVWDYVVSNMENNGKQFGEGKVAFDLPKGDTLFESIAWDPKRKSFLVGSAREGKIYLCDDKGKLADFISADANNGLMAVFDMAVDAANDKLWVISNGIPHFKNYNADMYGKAGLFEFSLSSGKFLHKYLLPVDKNNHILSSIAADSKGHVYVADGVNQEVYRLDGGALKLTTRNPALSGIRGMALSKDGKTLYLADISLGLFGIDLSSDKPFIVASNPDKLSLGGIDGLYWYDGNLVVIQNDMSPKRVMRLKLSADGRSIENAMPLDVAHPEFDAPTVGTIKDDGLYFVANSQKALYSALGALNDAEGLEPVHIFRSNLRFAWGQTGVSTSTVPASVIKDAQNNVPDMIKAPSPALQPDSATTEQKR